VGRGRQIGRLGAVGPIAFSPDGKILVTSSDGQVRLWDVATQRQIGHLFAAGGLGGPIAFSRDGNMLAVGSPDGTVRLWDLATRRQIGTPITVGPQVVYSVSFSPDGKVLTTGSSYLPSNLAFGSEDGTARLWDVATGQQIGSALSGGLAVFAPDGTTLVTNGGDTAAHLWSVDYLRNTLTRLCSQIGGTLTTAEWTRYIPPGPAYRNTCP
jgi:WD40 repeat protein